MDAARYARIRELVLRLRDTPPQEHESVLAEACGDDRELRREVEDLLRFEAEHREVVRTGAALIGARSGAFEEGEPEPPPETIDAYRIREELGRLDEAAPHLQEGLVIRRDTFDAGHRELCDSLRHLGDLRLRQGRLEEAESLLLEAYRALQDSLGPESGRTRSTAGLLAELYRERGDEATAAEYDRMAEADTNRG